MDFFSQDENLDAKYEERNNMSNLWPVGLQSPDLGPVDDFLNGAMAMMTSPSTGSNFTVSCLDYNSSDPSDASSLDDLDPDSLFYKKTEKSFIELRPLKSESHDPDSKSFGARHVSSSPYQLLNNGFSPDAAGLDSSYESTWTMLGLPGDIFTSGVPNQYIPFNESPFQEVDIWSPNNNAADQYRFHFEDSMATSEGEGWIKLEQVDLSDNGLPSTQNGPCLNSFESEFGSQMRMGSSPPLSFPSDYMNFGSPHFDTPCSEMGPTDFEEPDSDVSSPSSCSSLTEEFSTTSASGETSWVKEIKVGKNNRPRGPKCWEFVLRMLKDSAANPALVKWEDSSVGSFRLVEKDKISAIWGNRPSKKKNGKPIKYESFARILRYHYKKGRGMVLPVSEKHLVYKFAPRVMDTYKAGKVP